MFLDYTHIYAYIMHAVYMYLYSVSMCQTHKICIYTYTAPWFWSLLPLTLTIPI